MGRQPKPETNVVSMTIKVSRDLYSKLRILAIELNTSHILFIETILRNYIEQYNDYPLNRDCILQQAVEEIKAKK